MDERQLAELICYERRRAFGRDLRHRISDLRKARPLKPELIPLETGLHQPESNRAPVGF
jgi:hypothetical protein